MSKSADLFIHGRSFHMRPEQVEHTHRHILSIYLEKGLRLRFEKSAMAHTNRPSKMFKRQINQPTTQCISSLSAVLPPQIVRGMLNP